MKGVVIKNSTGVKIQGLAIGGNDVSTSCPRCGSSELDIHKLDGSDPSSAKISCPACGYSSTDKSEPSNEP